MNTHKEKKDNMATINRMGAALVAAATIVAAGCCDKNNCTADATADGAAADLGELHRGDLLFVRLKLKSAVERDYADLVIEDLFAGAFEPVHDAPAAGLPDWVMRTDARDDRMLVFSKKFRLGRNEEVVYTYPVRVVSSGVYALPAVAVEAMYQPRLAARFGAGRVVVRD